MPRRRNFDLEPCQDVAVEVEKAECSNLTPKRKTLHSEEPSYEIEKILDHKYDECDVGYLHPILGEVKHIIRTSMSS
jgi:transcriptional regulator of NAD metabolism